MNDIHKKCNVYFWDKQAFPFHAAAPLSLSQVFLSCGIMLHDKLSETTVEAIVAVARHGSYT